jgi:hypothetical protein
VSAPAFDIVCEIEPSTKPDLRHIEVRAELIERVTKDRRVGVDAACEQIERLRDSSAFDGVHLVPVARYREMALQLEARL